MQPTKRPVNWWQRRRLANERIGENSREKSAHLKNRNAYRMCAGFECLCFLPRLAGGKGPQQFETLIQLLVHFGISFCTFRVRFFFSLSSLCCFVCIHCRASRCALKMSIRRKHKINRAKCNSNINYIVRSSLSFARLWVCPFLSIVLSLSRQKNLSFFSYFFFH